MATTRYPRPTNELIAYNVSPEEFDPDGFYAGEFKCVRATDDLPPFDAVVKLSMTDRTRMIIEEYLDDNNICRVSRYFEEVLGEYSIPTGEASRTIYVLTGNDVQFVSVELIKRLQDKLLSVNPLWRVCFRCTSIDFSNDLLIYPTAVFTGVCVRGDLKNRVCEWQRTVLTAVEANPRIRFRRLMLNFVQNMLLNDHEIPIGRPVVPLAAFESAACADESFLVLFGFHYLRKVRIREVGTSRRPDMNVEGTYPVSSNGRIGAWATWNSGLGIEVVELPMVVVAKRQLRAIINLCDLHDKRDLKDMHRQANITKTTKNELQWPLQLPQITTLGQLEILDQQGVGE